MNAVLLALGVLALVVPSYFQLRSMDDTKLQRVRQDWAKLNKGVRWLGKSVVYLLPYVVSGYWIVQGWHRMATEPLTEGDVSLFVVGVALLVVAGMFMVLRVYLSRSNERHRDADENIRQELHELREELSKMATAAIEVVDGFKEDLEPSRTVAGLLGEMNSISEPERNRRDKLIRLLDGLRGKLTILDGSSLLKVLGRITKR